MKIELTEDEVDLIIGHLSASIECDIPMERPAETYYEVIAMWRAHAPHYVRDELDKGMDANTALDYKKDHDTEMAMLIRLLKEIDGEQAA